MLKCFINLKKTFSEVSNYSKRLKNNKEWNTKFWDHENYLFIRIRQIIQTWSFSQNHRKEDTISNIDRKVC